MANTNGSDLIFDIKYWCDTPELREQGLMHKPKLEDYECAFFIFNQAKSLSFWNANVSFGIDVIFADSAMTIINHDILKAYQEHPVVSYLPSIYVIEINEKYYEKINEYNKFKLKDNQIVFYNTKYHKSIISENESFQKYANMIWQLPR